MSTFKSFFTMHILLSFLFSPLILAQLTAQTAQSAQSAQASRAPQASQVQGYQGYTLASTGNPYDTTYDTTSTPANVSTLNPEPDVYLNASVHVGEIDILVANLSAKINLDAEVKGLLQLNAGVAASIDRVYLTIQQVNAAVLLEARLGNLVEIVNDILDSLDLNPIIATLSNDLTRVVNTTTGAVGNIVNGQNNNQGGAAAAQQSAGAVKRSFEMTANILYSVNNYQGHTHTNRVLAQNGDIVEQTLDDDGRTTSSKVIGNYKTDMTFTGHSKDVTGKNGENLVEQEYQYYPFPGLQVVALIYENQEGQAVSTSLIAEASGGGTSSVGSTMTMS